MPGEPMSELRMRIREQAPYPQIVTLGYPNGSGVFSVEMPREKARCFGSDQKTCIGPDWAFQLLVAKALLLLSKVSTSK
jgi:hypothetical protein